MSEQTAFAPCWLAREEDYARTMDTLVLPYISARRRDTTVPGRDGRPLFTSVFTADSPRGTVVIVHGFTENVDKYAELIHSLLRFGWNAVMWDQRGHGRSWRKETVAQDLSLTHVDRFEEYVGDMEAVCAACLPGLAGPRVLLAHSMGGAVSSLYLERHADTFRRAVLLSPMIAPNRGGIPWLAAWLMCGAQQLLGHGDRRIFASQPYSGPEDFDTSCATSRARFDWYDALKAKTPAFRNNGPTYAWTRQSLQVTRAILRHGAVERIACPVRMYAAQEDNSVLPEPQERFIRRVRRGERRVVPGSRHEIFRSPDGVVFPWWEEVLAFLSEADAAPAEHA